MTTKSTSKHPRSGGRVGKTKRPSPTRVMRAQIGPHVKTLSNGQPRPKRRGN